MNPNVLLAAGFIVLGIVLGYFLRFWTALRSRDSLESKFQKQIEAAKTEAKEIILSAKNEATKALADAQREERERKQDLRRLEEHLLKKESAIDKERAEVESLNTKKKEELEKLKETEEETKGLKTGISCKLSKGYRFLPFFRCDKNVIKIDRNHPGSIDDFNRDGSGDAYFIFVFFGIMFEFGFLNKQKLLSPDQFNFHFFGFSFCFQRLFSCLFRILFRTFGCI